MGRKICRYLIIALLLLPLNSLRAQEVALGVDAPSVVTQDEAFRLVYTATGKVDEFNPPTISDFNVLAGPTSSTSSRTSIINGKRTHTYEVSYTYILQAKAIGKFNIRPASVVVDKKTVSSKSVNVEVVKAQSSESSNTSASKSTPGIANDDIILRLQLNKSRVMEGEPIIATLKLYTKANIAGFEDVKFPTFNGFWSQEIETPTNIEFVRESLNGQIYSSALLRRYMLIPQQTGAIVIEPAEMVCQVQVRSSSGGRSRSMFDDFFDSYQTLRKRVITPKITVNVSALPAGAPASFTGGVGEFKMKVRLSRDSVSAHEAAALVVEVSGTGNINMVEPPKLNLPPDFELYDVKRSEKISGMTGSKKFEFPFIPRSAGDFTVEAPKFTYYSPKQKRYITISPKPLYIKVGRSTETNAVVVAGGLNKQFVKDLGSDIRFISTDSSRLFIGKSLVVVSIWFYLSYVIIIILLFGVLYILRKTIQRRSDIVGSKNRKAKKVAKARLKNAEGFLKQNLYTAFYEELHKAIIGYISDKFSLAMSDINRENISEKLTSRGSSQELVALLFSTLDACEYARYAPGEGYDAMENHYKDAIRVISEIES